MEPLTDVISSNKELALRATSRFSSFADGFHANGLQRPVERQLVVETEVDLQREVLF